MTYYTTSFGYESHLLADCDACSHRHDGARGSYRCRCGCTQHRQPDQSPELRARIEDAKQAFRARAEESP